MSQSLCKIYLHIIFHTKNDSPTIKEEDLFRVHAKIADIVNESGCSTIRIGGVRDHIHALVLLGRVESVAHLVEEIKRNSSRWIKSLSPRYQKFAWQSGYGAFSVSQSVVDKTIEYIDKQKEHHQHTDFRTELLSFLNHYNVEYDLKYLFED